MRRADRLFQIVQFLRGGRLVTAQALAERLEVSVRTIYRDIADLMSTGVPIDGDAGIGYVMRSGYDVPPLMFTNSKIAALIAGAPMVQAYAGADMAIAAQEALAKIRDVIPNAANTAAEGVTIQAITTTPMAPTLRKLWDQVEIAINNRQTLQFDYNSLQNISTRRIVRPLAQVFWGNVWTLVTWCELRHDYRTFRLDRMKNVDIGDTFKKNRDISFSNFLKRDGGRGKCPPVIPSYN